MQIRFISAPEIVPGLNQSVGCNVGRPVDGASHAIPCLGNPVWIEPQGLPCQGIAVEVRVQGIFREVIRGQFGEDSRD